LTASFFLSHWFAFNYAPTGGAWWTGAVWPNVFVVLVAAPLGWLWSRTRYWPLKPIQHGIRRLEAHHQRHDEHNEWAARELAAIRLHLTGEHAAQHPHHADIGQRKENS